MPTFRAGTRDQPGFLPTDHGFDHYFGLPYSNDMGLMRARPEARVPLPLLRDREVVQLQPDQTALTERYVEEAVRFLRASKGKPFFLYFAHMHVHRPLLVSERFLAGSRNGPYGAAVECIDWATAALLHEIRRLGLDGKTLILFTSDNGSLGDFGGDGGSNAPLRGHKGQSWEGGFRVPLLARLPGTIPGGATCREMLAAVDLLPTIAAFAGSPLPDLPIDGVDASGLFRGNSAHPPRQKFPYYWRNHLCAVRDGRWKLHFRSAGRKGRPMRALFDLMEDPAERQDLLADHPQIVARLEAAADAFREDFGDDATGVKGRSIRPAGRVPDPRPLAGFDPHHPYIIAAYDGDAG